MRPIRTIALISLCGLAAVACAQITKAKGGYLFRTLYKPGKIVRYQTTTTTGNVGSAAAGLSVKIPITLTVLSVSKGTAQVKVDMGKGSLNGSPYGEAHSTVIPLDAFDSSQTGGPKYPSYPVAIGGTWKAMRPVKIGGGQGVELNGLYRFQGIRSFEGHEVAVVTYTMSGAANGNGTMQLLTSDGTIYSNEMSIRVPKVGNNQIPQLHVVMSRFPEKSSANKHRK